MPDGLPRGGTSLEPPSLVAAPKICPVMAEQAQERRRPEANAADTTAHPMPATNHDPKPQGSRPYPRAEQFHEPGSRGPALLGLGHPTNVVQSRPASSKARVAVDPHAPWSRQARHREHPDETLCRSENCVRQTSPDADPGVVPRPLGFARSRV